MVSPYRRRLGRRVVASKRRGRPNTRKKIRAKAEDLFKVDPRFRELPHRTSQARELRAQLCGEETRYRDEMSGYKTSVIVQVIGEVDNDPSRSK